MSIMICAICGRYGIYWKNLGGLSPYTFCPNCGGINCQQLQPQLLEKDEEDYDD